jgi:hypothetical protein
MCTAFLSVGEGQTYRLAGFLDFAYWLHFLGFLLFGVCTAILSVGEGQPPATKACRFPDLRMLVAFERHSKYRSRLDVTEAALTSQVSHVPVKLSRTDETRCTHRTR